MKALIFLLLFVATGYSQVYEVFDTTGIESTIVIGEFYNGEEIVEKELDGDVIYYDLADGRMIAEHDNFFLELKNDEIKLYIKQPERKWLEKKEGVFGKAE